MNLSLSIILIIKNFSPTENKSLDNDRSIVEIDGENNL